MRPDPDAPPAAQATARLGPQYTADALQAGLDAVEALIPGFNVDLERLKARDWAALLLEPNAVAVKLVTLKASFPTADLARILAEMPRLLLDDVAKIQSNAAQVRSRGAPSGAAAALLGGVAVPGGWADRRPKHLWLFFIGRSPCQACTLTTPPPWTPLPRCTRCWRRRQTETGWSVSCRC